MPNIEAFIYVTKFNQEFSIKSLVLTSCHFIFYEFLISILNIRLILFINY